MKKQKTESKVRIFFPVLVVLSLMSQACNKSSGSGTKSAAPVAKNETPICSRASAEQASFFQEVDSSASVPGDEPEKSVRNRHVKVDVAALKNALLTSHVPLRIDLFDDKQLEVQVEQVQKISDRNLIMLGHVNGEVQNVVTMVLRDDVLVANLHQDHTRYEIKFRGKGIHSIHQFTAFDSEDCLTAAPPHPRVDEPIDSRAEAGSVPVIDILVAYTPGAKASVGGVKAMKALIQMGMADTNRAFQNSGVALAARLVGTMELSQNDTNDFSVDLGRLQNSYDGFWDEVHSERARLGASQVTVVGVYPNNNVNGIGYIRAAADSAFTVVKASAFGVYSFTHELGHNVGLNHSDGMENPSGGFRTIMAYGSYPRIPRFSNPQLTFENYWTGAIDHDSARILNASGSYTAHLVPHRIGFSPAVPVYTPPPATCQ